jgi:aminoglycoside phosphotransferase (APT) family kinase protein
MSAARGCADAKALALRVGAALTAHGVPSSVPRLRPLAGGTSGLTYLGEDAAPGACDTVIKVAPEGLAPVGHRDVLRQARLLCALSAIGIVPVPRVLALDEGRGPAEPPLFIMEFVAGSSWEPLHDPCDPLPQAAEAAARLEQAARLLAEMHAVDPDRLPPTPGTTLDGELDHWAKAFDSAGIHPTLSGRCERLLRRTLPKPMPPVLVHGDWRLGNMLCQAERIVAVIDWEIWSVGDPRTDLGWLDIMTDPAHPRAIRTPYWTLAEGALHDAYAAVRHRPEDLAWFGTFAKYKQSAITALQAKHRRERNLGAAQSLADLARSLLEWAIA